MEGGSYNVDRSLNKVDLDKGRQKTAEGVEGRFGFLHETLA
jgi:hypothetical protein